MKERKKNFIINKINPDEFTSFEKFEQKLKESIFGVLYVLLKDDNSSSLVLDFVFTIIEFIQFMMFPFNETVRDSWGGSSFVTTIYNSLNYMETVHYLQDLSASIYLTVFYTSLSLVILMIVNIAYVSYSFSRNFFTVTWPLYVLRYVAKAVVTIFFMPLQEIFISILSCSVDSTGKSVNSFSPSIECWTGFHFLHLFCSIAVSIVFIMISLIVALTYFECNDGGDNHGAKVNSRSDVIMLISKIISILCFTFFKYPEYEWFVICVILFLSIIQFSTFYYEKPYYNNTLQTLMEVCNALYIWTNFVLLISKIFKPKNFTGGIYIWAAGIPLVIISFVFKRSDIISLLSKNLTKFEKGEEVEKQMRYFIRLFDRKGKHRESEILLKGFIRNHEENCGMSDCPLKEVKKLLDSSSGNLDIFNKGHQIQQNLLNFANRIYMIGLAKFPNCASLRIAYSLFLYHHLKQKMNALQEFSNAEKSSPPFDLQFIIFRYKKIINEEQDTVENVGEALDVVSGIAYDSHFRQCQTNIGKAAMLFLDFWGILTSHNSTPDLYKMNELGLKINETLKNVHTHWNHMQRYKEGDPKALRMYASFWIEILNNKEKGQQFLNSKESGEKRQVVMKDFHLGKDQNISTNMNEGYALLLCSAEPDNFGTIIKSTSNGCKIFGYTQNELWGKHLDNLFLDIYYGNISNYIRQNIKEWDYEKSKKCENFYGKTKSHHCVSLNVQLIDPKKVINDKFHFLLLIWSDFNVIDLKQNKRTCHFIINNSLTIFNYSFQAIEFLYLLYGKLPGENFLHALFPEICREVRRDKNQEYNLKITDTLINDLLSDIASKQELVIKSRANRQDISGSYFVDQEFFKRSYHCEFSVKVIETNMNDKEDLIAIMAKKDENEMFNQAYLREEYYSVKIEYHMNHNNHHNKKGITNRNSLLDIETCHTSLFKKEIKEDLSLNRETTPLKLDISTVKDHLIDSMNGQLHEKRFNLNMVENIHLKMDLNRVINELNDKNDLNYTLMNYVKDLDKFKNLFKWYTETELQNLNNNTYIISSNMISSYTLKKNNTKKGSEKNKKLRSKKNQESGQGVTNLENYNVGSAEPITDNMNKLDVNSINNVFNTNNYVAGSEREITDIMNNKKDEDTGLKRNNKVLEEKDQYDSDNEESFDDDDDDDMDSNNSSEMNSSSHKEEESFYEEAIDIIRSHNNLDLATLNKRLVALKDYSKNVEFSFYKESPDRSNYPVCCQIIEVMKNANLLHDSDGDSRREKNVEVTIPKKSRTSNDTNSEKTPPSLNKLRTSSFLTILIMLTYSIIEFSYNVNANTNTVNNFEMIFHSYEALNEVTWVSYLVRNLMLTNNNNFTNYAGIKNLSSFITMNYDALNVSYHNLMQIASNLSNSNLDILPQHYQMIKSPIVPLYFENSVQSSKTNYFTLPDAIKSIYVKILTIMQQVPSDIIENNIDVMNLQFNIYNDFLIYLQKSASYYTQLMHNNCDYYYVVFVVFFIVCIIISILLTIIIYINLTKVDIDRTKILGAFYEIPTYYVNKLNERCLKFLEKFDKNEDHDSDDNSEDNSFYEEMEHLNRRGFRKGVMNHNIGQSSKLYLFQISIAFICVIGFFFINFLSNIFSFTNLKRFNNVYNTTLQAEYLYTFTFNLVREKLINNKFQVFNNTGINIINETIQQIYDLNGVIVLQHVEDKPILSDTYIKVFKDTFYSNLCSLVPYVDDQDNCNNFLNGLAQYGLQVVIIRFFEFLRTVYSNYLLNASSFTSLEILNNQILNDLTVIIQKFFKIFLETVAFDLKDNMNSYLSSELNIRMVIFISFLIFIILGYFFIWLPFENKLNDEITRTKKMLDIIPSHIIERIDSLKEM